MVHLGLLEDEQIAPLAQPAEALILSMAEVSVLQEVVDRAIDLVLEEEVMVPLLRELVNHLLDPELYKAVLVSPAVDAVEGQKPLETEDGAVEVVEEEEETEAIEVVTTNCTKYVSRSACSVNVVVVSIFRSS